MRPTGYLNVPAVGRSILGDGVGLMAGLKSDEHAIFIIANGTGSFKGSGFVRGGIFDRIQVSQGLDLHVPRPRLPEPLQWRPARRGIANRASSSSATRASAAHTRGASFSSATRWTGRPVRAASRPFEQEYWVPARYLEGGRPAVQARSRLGFVWKARKLEIAAFVLFLAATVDGLRAARPAGAPREPQGPPLGRRAQVPDLGRQHRDGRLLFHRDAEHHPRADLVPLASRFQWRWDLFLSDPLIFIFWWFIIITVFIWGRSRSAGGSVPMARSARRRTSLAGALGLKR